MSDFVHSKHDIGITRADGSTVGLMLARRRDGSPDYEEVDDEQLAEQRAMGEPGYGWFRPTRELPLIQDDWREGLGQYIYDRSSPKRYHASYGMDFRFPNMGIAGPKAAAVNKPTIPVLTLVNADMELATGWTGGAGQSTDFARSLIYSWKITAGGEVYQDVNIWKPGIIYTFKIWARRGANVAGGRLGINDGITTKYSDEVQLTTSWQELTITYRLSVAATRLRVIFEETGETWPAYFDDASVSGTITLGTTKAMAEYNSKLYASFGSILGKLNATGDAFTCVADLIATITALEPFADGFLHIGRENTVTTIEDCEDVWDAGGSVTVSIDTGDYKVGTASVKCVVAAGAGINQIIASETFTAMDLTATEGLKAWVKSSVALSANDWQIRLYEGGTGGTLRETLNLPALSANVWNRVYLKYTTPANLTAINAISLYQVVDKGAMNFWIDDVGAENLMCYMGVDELLTLSTQSDGFAKFLKAVNATTPTLWKALPPRELKSNTAPATGAWSGATNVDTLYYNITALISKANSLYIMKEDRPFYLDVNSNVKVLVDDTRKLASATGGKNSITWQERLYMPYGTQSLVEYDESGDINWRDPAIQMTNLPDFDGQVQALAADERYLFAAIYFGNKTEILSGSYETIDGATGWHWHGALTELTLLGCELLYASSIYKRRLWITSVLASDGIYYIPLYDGYGDPLTDTNRLFQTDVYSITPYLHGEFKADNKAYFELRVHLGHTYDVDIYFEAHYEKANDTTWTKIADLKGTNTNRIATAYIPDDASGNDPVSRMLRLKFVVKTDDTSKTPVLLSYNIRAKLYPQKGKLIQCVARGADNPLNKQKQPDGISAASIKEVLDEANHATWPVAFYDLWNNARKVAIVEMREHPIIHEQEPQNIERHFALVFQEITLS